MHRSPRRLLNFAFGLSLITGSASAQLEINLDFTNFLAGPSGNTNAILNGASLQEAMDAMEHAAAIWEDVFADSTSSLSWADNGLLVRNIDVGWLNHGGGTLARGGLTWNSRTSQWAGSGFVNWDGDGSSSFFVDTTPGDNEEWRQYSDISTDLNGITTNVGRVSYDAPPGITRDNSDFLSIATHEITHALGMITSFPRYRDAAIEIDLDGDGEDDRAIDITSGPFSGALVPIRSTDAHTDFEIDSPGNDALGPGRSDFPYEVGGNSFFRNSNLNPANMAPSILRGVRLGMTEADILIVAQFLGFDMDTVNFNPDPFAITLGDLDGDGSLTDADISAFVQALTDPAGYAAAYPTLDPDTLGDFSGDGVLSNSDIQGFANTFGTNAANLVPEPTSLAVIMMAGGLAMRRRR